MVHIFCSLLVFGKIPFPICDFLFRPVQECSHFAADFSLYFFAAMENMRSTEINAVNTFIYSVDVSKTPQSWLSVEVAQQPLLFDTSIRNNLTYGCRRWGLRMLVDR